MIVGGAFLVLLLFVGLGDPLLSHAGPEPGPDLIPHLDAIAALARPSPMVTVPAGWFLMGTNLKHDEIGRAHV